MLDKSTFHLRMRPSYPPEYTKLSLLPVFEGTVTRLPIPFEGALTDFVQTLPFQHIILPSTLPVTTIYMFVVAAHVIGENPFRPVPDFD